MRTEEYCMKNYEIVLLFTVNEENLSLQTVDKFKQLVSDKGGKIDRFEDWGNLKLAYPINKNTKAHYILMNISANNEILIELSGMIKYNDNILRHIILSCKEAITEPSLMLKKEISQAS
tara:strand:+ start:253883 stop:254239 length:357 start_codon:yes stop_codon:yes gene_type:complete